MTDSFENQMNDWLKKAGGLAEFTIEEREQVNKAGANTLKTELAKATKERHYNPNRRVIKMKHLADSYAIGDLDGSKPNGDVAVGFTTKDANHARIARFLNDGTVKMKGDSFYDQAVIASKEKTFNSIFSALSEIQARKAK